jgi:hypothetical protein
MGAGLAGTSLVFVDTGTAASANITANGGVGQLRRWRNFLSGRIQRQQCQHSLSSNATLDISTQNALGVTICSLAGEGSVFLGTNTFTIGSNNQSTTFSGVIQDTGGVIKSNTAALTLIGSNTYTGKTTLTAGLLGISNTRN